MSSKPILLAMPEEWNTLASGDLPFDYLRNSGFNVITASTYDDAIKAIHSQILSAVVMTSDWAIKQEDGSPGLIELLKGKVPTMSLITATTYRDSDNWMDELFDPREHEYQHMPADIDAIVMWLNQITENEI